MGQPITQKSKDEFAKVCRAWRARRGYSQSEAALSLGLTSVRTLQNWEIARTRPSGVLAGLLLELFSEK